MAVIAGSLAPDMDFLFLFLDNFNEFHRTWSHSIFFLVGIAMVVSAAANRYLKVECCVVFVSFVIGSILHIAIDSVLDNNPTNGLGVAFFYPVSTEMFQLFSVSFYRPVPNCDWSTIRCMARAAVPMVLVEAVLLTAVLVLYGKTTGTSSRQTEV